MLFVQSNNFWSARMHACMYIYIHTYIIYIIIYMYAHQHVNTMRSTLLPIKRQRRHPAKSAHAKSMIESNEDVQERTTT